MNLKDKIAVITGGSEGIGLGISRALAQEGAFVYLVARTQEKLEAAQKKIREEGGRAEIRRADITDFIAMNALIESIYADHGAIDIFVNNAGTYRPTTLDSELEHIHHLDKLDFIAPRDITHLLIQKAKRTTHPLSIVTVLSQAALRPMVNGIGYGSAKRALAGALIEYQYQLECEGVSNVRLAQIYPGTVGTESVMELVSQGKLQNPIPLEDVVSATLDLIKGHGSTNHLEVRYCQGGSERHYYNPDSRTFFLLGESKN